MSEPAGPGRSLPEAAPASVHARRARWIVPLVLLCVFAAKAVGVYVERDRRDYWRWHAAAEWSLAGKPLVAEAGGPAPPGAPAYEPWYKLPPAFAVLISPLGLLPYEAYVLIWYALSLTAAVVGLLLYFRLVTGRYWPEDPCVLLPPVVLIAGLVWEELHNGQQHLLILAMLAFAAWASWRKWLWCIPAGLAVGLAISIKAFPAPLVLFLALLRRWRVALWGLAGAAVWTLLVPGAVRGLERNWRETTEWYGRIVNPYVTGQEGRTWEARAFYAVNQSAYAGLHRLLRPVDAIEPPPGEPAQRANLANLSRGQVDVVFLGWCVAVVLAVAAAGLWHGPADSSAAVGVDFALACLAMLALTPLAWDYFYTAWLPAMVVAAWWARQAPAGLERHLCVASLALTAPALVALLIPPARAYSPLMWLNLLYLAAMIAVRHSLAGKQAGCHGRVGRGLSARQGVCRGGGG